MTEHRPLPLYNNALGAAQETLVVPPPFSYPGVSARIFPLRTSLNLLSSFCQRYLNVAPEICQFRPYLPYVLLVVLDYGRMALEDANLGWVSQHEIFFEVPLGMWTRDSRNPRGRLIFDKWVVNTPFMVVDNPASLTTGRETYGWPKVLGELQYSPESWLIDPRNPIRFLTLDVKGLSSNMPDARLLEIEQKLDQNVPLAPPDFGLLDPFGQLSRLNRAACEVGFDLAQFLVGAPLAGFGPWSPGDRFRVLTDSFYRLFSFLGGPGLDVVTLKQFRAAGKPTKICYQALVESRLRIERYNRGGFLGLYNLLQGDITGGFRIHLHENPAFPIVASLGLDAARKRVHGGCTVWTLEPSFPFWMSVDLTYDKGRTTCWRRYRTPWHEGNTPVPYSQKSKVTFSYNTVAGAAEQVWYGPFLIPEASFDVFFLPANQEKLQEFVDRYLTEPSGIPFRCLGKHVWMVASSNRIFSQERAAAWIDSREVSFYILLQWGEPENPLIGMATPFCFVDNPTLAMTLREVQGVPAMDALVEAPSWFWKSEGPRLTLKTDVFTALEAGLGGEKRTLIDVDYPPAVPLQSSKGNPVQQQFIFPLDRLMLKQFRDAGDPERACYQALISERWLFSEIKRLTFLPNQTKVHIYRYPSLPLVDTLGLTSSEIVPPQEPGGAVADVIVPEHPFRIELSVKVELGQVLSDAAHTSMADLNRLLPHFSMSGFRSRKGKSIPKQIRTLLLESVRQGAGVKKRASAGGPPLETGGVQS